MLVVQISTLAAVTTLLFSSQVYSLQQSEPGSDSSGFSSVTLFPGCANAMKYFTESGFNPHNPNHCSSIYLETTADYDTMCASCWGNMETFLAKLKADSNSNCSVAADVYTAMLKFDTKMGIYCALDLSPSRFSVLILNVGEYAIEASGRGTDFSGYTMPEINATVCKDASYCSVNMFHSYAASAWITNATLASQAVSIVNNLASACNVKSTDLINSQCLRKSDQRSKKTVTESFFGRIANEAVAKVNVITSPCNVELTDLVDSKSKCLAGTGEDDLGKAGFHVVSNSLTLFSLVSIMALFKRMWN